MHESLLGTIWLDVANGLLDANVRLLCDDATIQRLVGHPKFVTHVQKASDEAYVTEHLGLTISVLSVPSLQAAVKWINGHSSHHTDAIVTQDEAAAAVFCRSVDSAGTFVNASTRFADGFRYGFGTEVGISTGRIHARGPVGLDGLMIYKYMLRSKAGKGHIVGEFGSGKKAFKHKRIENAVVPY